MDRNIWCGAVAQAGFTPSAFVSTSLSSTQVYNVNYRDINCVKIIGLPKPIYVQKTNDKVGEEATYVVHKPRD